MSEDKKPESLWLNHTFTALADPMRRQIIEVILEYPGLTVNELWSKFPISRFTIMRHLNILDESGLLSRERDGKTKRLFIQDTALKRLREGWLKRVSNYENRKNRKERGKRD